ncbi:MAG: phosphoribosylanthranilate isomerase [Chromatiales bacterium]|nr:phosphoribosylanthranilate isomerase [Chromatiales bacterium]MYF67859.1 phosphoribosylanthranilate isomerase [Gammaproteobacteria bacterium]
MRGPPERRRLPDDCRERNRGCGAGGRAGRRRLGRPADRDGPDARERPTEAGRRHAGRGPPEKAAVSLFVKICGATRPDAVEAAVEAGADAIGFNFHPPSPRFLSPRRATALAGPVPAHVQRVAVMLRPQQSEWDEVFEGFRPDCLQADADCLATLRLPDEVGRLPVYRDHEQFDTDSFSIEIPCLFESAVSGQGQPPSWERAALLAHRASIMLAGGLDPENVGEAVRRVRPWGVDVSSGVESSSGVKDPRRVRAFIHAARKADLA